MAEDKLPSQLQREYAHIYRLALPPLSPTPINENPTNEMWYDNCSILLYMPSRMRRKQRASPLPTRCAECHTMVLVGSFGVFAGLAPHVAGV